MAITITGEELVQIVRGLLEIVTDILPPLDEPVIINNRLNQLETNLMALEQNVADKISALTASQAQILATLNTVVAENDKQNALIQELKDKVAAGTPVDNTELIAALDSVLAGNVQINGALAAIPQTVA